MIKRFIDAIVELIGLTVIFGFAYLIISGDSLELLERSVTRLAPGIHGTQPLVMKGGDPYIRALMRTITASEANDSRPYNVIYGGKHVQDLSKHPNLCVPIVRGPNVGKCTTAAGRYQFLNSTWYDKALRYHPRPIGFWRWQAYSFEAQYQDAVVYAWLNDSSAWGVNLGQMLRKGQIKQVLRRLSGTWTSLGYGIETNSMSRHLPTIYEKMLREELGQTRGLQQKLMQSNLVVGEASFESNQSE